MPPTTIQRVVTPEEEELERKRGELALLETVLAEREEEYASLQFTVDATHRRYMHTVGIRLAELDDLNARIAVCYAELYPDASFYQRQAEEASSKAQESASATGGIEKDAMEDTPLEPPEQLKTTYRKLAKAVHPDLAKDDQDRARRTKVMAEVNAAYQSGDASRLQQILNDWEQSADTAVGEGVGAELVRVIRKIAAVKTRIVKLDQEISQLKQSELYQLHERIQAAAAHGRDLLHEMSQEIEAEIHRKQEQLAALRERQQREKVQSDN